MATIFAFEDDNSVISAAHLAGAMLRVCKRCAGYKDESFVSTTWGPHFVLVEHTHSAGGVWVMSPF